MGQKTLEGTWEEISLHASELLGRKVRVTVLDEPDPKVTLDKALAHLISAAEQLADTLPPKDSSPADAWSEGVEEKFRKQGFML